jgi:hypothetical protein
VGIFADVGIYQPSLVSGDLAESVLDLDLAITRGFNFGPGQH